MLRTPAFRAQLPCYRVIAPEAESRRRDPAQIIDLASRDRSTERKPRGFPSAHSGLIRREIDIWPPARSSDLEQHLPEGLFTEPNDRRFPDAHGGRSKVARRSQHLLDDFLEIRRLHFEEIELLSLRDIDLGGTLGDLGSLISAELATRGNLFFHFYFVCIQKLGRSGAARSTLTEVVPVDLLGHHLPQSAASRRFSSRSGLCPDVPNMSRVSLNISA